LISEAGTQYGNAKSLLDRRKGELEQHLSRLEREKQGNKEKESEI